MKFTIEKTSLLKSLSHVQNIVEKKGTVAILSNILIDANDAKLIIKATDLDIEATEKVEANITEKGAITVSAHLLYDIVRKLPEGSQVEFVYPDSQGRMSIKSGKTKEFNLSCLPVEDFPTMSDDGLPSIFSLSVADLKTVIDRTHFAVSTEETRYYLNGIYLHSVTQNGSQVLRAAATDGHRLARVEFPAPANIKEINGIIIPRKTVLEIRKLLEEAEGSSIDISFSDTKIRFALDNIVLSSKLIDGTYPDYEKVIPTDNDKVLEVEVEDLKNAVDCVSIFSERTKGIKISVASGKITASASTPDAGTATDTVSASYEGDAMEIGFNFRYVLDVLQVIKGDTVRIIMKDGASPALLSDPADNSSLYVIMPMRV